MSEKNSKILIIRFSSFGDILQTLSVVSALKTRWPDSEVHWVIRSEFIELIKDHPGIQRVWSLDRRQGFKGLLKLAFNLHQCHFTRVYDAHNNLRSWVLCNSLSLLSFFSFHKGPKILKRSLRRWKRFLLFKFRINQFEQPFSGQRDLLEPMIPWGISSLPPAPPQLFFSKDSIHQFDKKFGSLRRFVALAPSAAFALKRWPLEHWKKLILLWLEKDPTIRFGILGGPEDLFLKELLHLKPENITLWAGKLSLLESSILVSKSQLLIANDTGLLHVGEQLGHPSIALMGPAPFGFPCRSKSTTILELSLPCRPCSKHGQGPCKNTNYQWCLAGITPEKALEESFKKITSMPSNSSQLKNKEDLS